MYDADYRISGEDAELIREMLLVGLASYGEVEKTRGAFDLAELYGRPVGEDAKPAHPTGESDTVAKFATVLSCLNGMLPVVRPDPSEVEPDTRPEPVHPPGGLAPVSRFTASP